MKLQFLRLFLLFISAISLHGASAAPLESVLEKSYVLESPSTNQKTLEQLLSDIKVFWVVQSQPSQAFYIEYTTLSYPKIQNELDIETRIVCYQQSLITFNRIPLITFNQLPQYNNSTSSPFYPIS